MCCMDGGAMAVTPLTVLQMVPALQGGGVERGTLEVARALVLRGHHSLVLSSGGHMVEQLVGEGSEHICWPVDRKSPLSLRLIWPLRRLLRERKVDILHYRSRVPGWIAYLAWRGMGAQRPRLISTVHGLHSVSPYSAVMTKGERVIAVSETVRNYIHQNYPQTPSESVELIYRGVDPKAFPFGFQPDETWLRAWRSQYPQLNSRLVVALPGRMTRLKGHHDFIVVIQALLERGVDLVGLVIGGEDPKRRAYAREIYQEVSRRGLQDRILFTGHRDDMREIYSQCDAVLSLSRKPESFGRTVLEALALGRPVVGYDHGGVGEILEALYPVGRIPLGDVAEVTERLSEPLSPVKAFDRFTQQSMLDRTLGLYESLVETPVVRQRKEPDL